MIILKREFAVRVEIIYFLEKSSSFFLNFSDSRPGGFVIPL